MSFQPTGLVAALLQRRAGSVQAQASDIGPTRERAVAPFMGRFHASLRLGRHPLLVMAGLALTCLLPLASLAHPKGMHKTKADAQKRAQELNCEGTFQMGSLWMPCANERALHKALQNN